MPANLPQDKQQRPALQLEEDPSKQTERKLDDILNSLQIPEAQDAKLYIPELERAKPVDGNPNDEPPTGVKGMWHFNRRLAIVCMAAVILLGMYTIGFVFQTMRNATGRYILPNVSIAGIDVGGLSYPTEAVQVVTEKLGNAYLGTSMVVNLDGVRIVLTPEDVKASLNVRAAVAEAYDFGHTTPAEEGASFQVDIVSYLTLDTDYIYSTLKKRSDLFSGSFNQSRFYLEGPAPALDSEFFNAASECQTLVMVVGTPGSALDLETVYERVLNAYYSGQFYVEVTTADAAGEMRYPDPLDLNAIARTVNVKSRDLQVNEQNRVISSGSYGCAFSMEEAQALLDQSTYGDVIRIPMEYVSPQLPEGCTQFPDELSRGQIHLENYGSPLAREACQKLNGTIIQPGETFSLLSILGQTQQQTDCTDVISEDEGYCQLASALWQSAVCADLLISEVHHHNYVPDFTEAAMDVAIRQALVQEKNPPKNSKPSPDDPEVLPPLDLQIRNPSGKPVILLADITADSLNVRVFGTETRSYYSVLTSTVRGTLPFKTVYEPCLIGSEHYENEILRPGFDYVRSDVLKTNYRISNDVKQGASIVSIVNYPGVNQILATMVTELPEENAKNK